jgi:hypothetical protein
VQVLVALQNQLTPLANIQSNSCEACQKQIGGAHGLLITVRRKNLTWSDPETVLSVYETYPEDCRSGEGKGCQRYFCGNCGSFFAQFSDMVSDLCKDSSDDH